MPDASSGNFASAGWCSWDKKKHVFFLYHNVRLVYACHLKERGGEDRRRSEPQTGAFFILIDSAVSHIEGNLILFSCIFLWSSGSSVFNEAITYFKISLVSITSYPCQSYNSLCLEKQPEIFMSCFECGDMETQNLYRFYQKGKFYPWFRYLTLMLQSNLSIYCI